MRRPTRGVRAARAAGYAGTAVVLGLVALVVIGLLVWLGRTVWEQALGVAS